MTKPFRPMLASRELPDLNSLKYPIGASPKLDGIRCVTMPNGFGSRTMKDFPNQGVDKKFAELKGLGFDGELIYGWATTQDVRRRTTSCVMSHSHPVEDLLYFVFDIHDKPGMSYKDRMFVLADRYATLSAETRRHVFPLVGKHCHSPEEVLAYEREVLQIGYEGLILRDLAAPYKNGRSTEREGYMMKLKRFVDGEAEIIGFEERMTNTNEEEINELGYTKRSSSLAGKVPGGTLGSLQVRDTKTKVEFSVGQGPGLDDALRLQIWLNKDKFLGRLITYKHFPYGAKDKPNLPKFVDFREKGM